jgi:hypothetical protein
VKCFNTFVPLNQTKETMQTAFLITEVSDTETPFIGVLFLKDTVDETIDRLNDAISDHFDVAVEAVFVHNAASLQRGIPVWESEKFDVDLGGGDEAVIEIRSIYVY